jgi:sigma-E factor negative regulatory protein RseC
MTHLNCDSGHCCQGEDVLKVILEMNNEINAHVGDKIVFEAKQVGMLSVAFILFALPLILTTLGAITGYYLSGNLAVEANTASIVGGITAFIISALVIKGFDRFVATNKSLRPVIKRIL